MNATASHLDHDLAARITGFVRALRENGFRHGLQESADVLRTLGEGGLLEPRLARWRMRSLLCGSHREWKTFDELYDHYWFATRRRSRLRETVQPAASERRPVDPGELAQAAPDAARGAPVPPGSADTADEAAQDRDGAPLQALPSRAESLERRDFRRLHDAAEQRAMEALAERVARRMRRRLGARLRRHHRGLKIDLAGTLRGALPTAGEPLRLVLRRRRPRQPRLALVIDVSASMNPYAMFMLRFARGLCTVFPRLRVFAFHTRLVDIGDCLHEPTGPRMAARLAALSEGWSGGTRIGPSLETLLMRYGRELFRGRTSLIVVSDGLDTAEPAVLEGALQALRPRCRRLYWLNPLLGRDGYAPRARAMQLALPYLDAFAPAHDLASLIALEPLLRRC
ncbi:vWA domain-containing protein [Sinimarinibacterium flocculans]|uniref:VWFA domain-containing protein n=1 Tax=Sinimarinibacterium flocculans TaxID=985250 RepID=A0A318E3I1_9GAMM|nr:VWA domain-containing protein [Sinimarinibacterium flocculans]PXV65708.1 hypothetical protein C8D93_10987 [Sinimarinibacterium flocculans]